jgi:hypothetical protein
LIAPGDGSPALIVVGDQITAIDPLDREFIAHSIPAHAGRARKPELGSASLARARRAAMDLVHE